MPAITKDQLQTAIRQNAIHATMEFWLRIPRDQRPANHTPLDLNHLPPSCELCIAGFAFVLAGTPIKIDDIGISFQIPDAYTSHFAYLAALVGIPLAQAKHLVHPDEWPDAINQAYATAHCKGDATDMANAMCQAIDHFIPNP